MPDLHGQEHEVLRRLVEMDARTITVGDLAKLRKDARTALAAREEPPKNQLQAIVDFLDSWRYCPVSSSPNRARQCLEDAAGQLLTALDAAHEDDDTVKCDSCNRSFPLSAIRFGRGGKASCPNCLPAREDTERRCRAGHRAGAQVMSDNRRRVVYVDREPHIIVVDELYPRDILGLARQAPKGGEWALTADGVRTRDPLDECQVWCQGDEEDELVTGLGVKVVEGMRFYTCPARINGGASDA